MQKHFVCAAIALCLGLSSAEAQDSNYELPKGKAEVIGFGGAAAGLGASGVLGGGVSVAATDRVLVGGEFGYVPGGDRGLSFSSPVSSSEFSSKTMYFSGGAYYRFLLDNPKLVPYAGVSVLYWRSSFTGTTTSPLFPGQQSSTLSYSATGIGFGGGIRYHLTPNLGFRPDVKLVAGGGGGGAVLSVGLFYQFK